MTDEVVADTPAPELEVTATPEPVVEAPVETPPPKTFTQEELDAAISKRLAREQRKWERERSTVEPPPPVEPPSGEDPAVLQRAEQIAREREQQRQHAQILESYHEREETAREKYDDFEQVAYNPKLPITTVMAQTIQQSEVGPDIAYHLGVNPKEAERISKLPPLVQAKEIGKIEAKLAADPPAVKKVSSAPAPIGSVAPRGASSTPAYDTTDPRSIKSMSTSEWIEAERLRQIKKQKAMELR